jgi:hypothetical protein
MVLRTLRLASEILKVFGRDSLSAEYLWPDYPRPCCDTFHTSHVTPDSTLRTERQLVRGLRLWRDWSLDLLDGKTQLKANR